MIVLSIYKPWILDLHSLHIHADQLGGEFWQLINPFRPSKLDDDVLALDIAEVVQARPQGLNPARRSSSRAETQAADARDSRRLLRARCERPRCYRAAKQRDELSPFHSITSSARPSRGSGMVRPSALAVFKLIISSIFVTCWTGRSAGFSPLR